MGGGSFMAGLLSGFGESMLKSEETAYAQKVKDLQDLRQIVASIASDPSMEPALQQKAITTLLESRQQEVGPMGWRGKAKKAGAPISEFLGALGKMPAETQPGRTEERPYTVPETVMREPAAPIPTRPGEALGKMPVAPPPAPQAGAVLPALPSMRTETTPRVLGMRRAPEEVAQEQARAQAAQVPIIAEAYRAAGLRPPTSMAAAERHESVSNVPGESIGKPAGTLWHVTKDIDTQQVLSSTQITPAYTQTGQREGWTIEDGQYVRVVMDREGNAISKQYNLIPPASYVGTTTEGYITAVIDNQIYRVPTTTVRRPLAGPAAAPRGKPGAAPGIPSPPARGKAAAAPPAAGAKAELPPGLPKGTIKLGAKGLTPQQRQTTETGVATLDAALSIMDRIKPNLARLRDPVRGIHLQAAMSAARGAQEGGILSAAYTRTLTATLDEEDKVLLGEWVSALEHVQRMRAVMTGAAGFRSQQAFETLLNQLGNPAVDPTATARTLENTYNTLAAYRDTLKRSLGGGGLPEVPGAKGQGPAGATHTGIGSVDKKKHWLDANGKDLGVVAE